MGGNTPTISVIIPTYNRAHQVGRAIQSVLDQTYQDFEIIVVDDASTDNTEKVVQGFNECVADARSLEKEQILKIVESVFRERNKTRRHLEGTIPSAKKDVLYIF